MSLILASTAMVFSLASANPSPPDAATPMASAADPDGRMTGFQLNRRYGDVIQVDGRKVQRTVEYGFDYTKRTTVKKVFDADGKLLVETEEPGATLRASAAEEARLVELVRTHPQLEEKMAEPDLHIYAGGFVLQDPKHPHCWLHSRCIRVVVSKGDGSTGHVYALVDLVTDRVVEPFHAPIQTGSSNPQTARE